MGTIVRHHATMPETRMQKAIQSFEQDFARWGVHLPDDDVAARRSGTLRAAGWHVWYDFGRDSRGEFLDYYAAFRDGAHDAVTDDWHVRLYDTGERVPLPTVLEAYMYSRDPTTEELARARRHLIEPAPANDPASPTPGPAPHAARTATAAPVPALIAPRLAPPSSGHQIPPPPPVVRPLRAPVRQAAPAATATISGQASQAPSSAPRDSASTDIALEVGLDLALAGVEPVPGGDRLANWMVTPTGVPAVTPHREPPLAKPTTVRITAPKLTPIRPVTPMPAMLAPTTAAAVVAAPRVAKPVVAAPVVAAPVVAAPVVPPPVVPPPAVVAPNPVAPVPVPTAVAAPVLAPRSAPREAPPSTSLDGSLDEQLDALFEAPLDAPTPAAPAPVDAAVIGLAAPAVAMADVDFITLPEDDAPVISLHVADTRVSRDDAADLVTAALSPADDDAALMIVPSADDTIFDRPDIDDAPHLEGSTIDTPRDDALSTGLVFLADGPPTAEIALAAIAVDTMGSTVGDYDHSHGDDPPPLLARHLPEPDAPNDDGVRGMGPAPTPRPRWADAVVSAHAAHPRRHSTPDGVLNTTDMAVVAGSFEPWWYRPGARRVATIAAAAAALIIVGSAVARHRSRPTTADSEAPSSAPSAGTHAGAVSDQSSAGSSDSDGTADSTGTSSNTAPDTLPVAAAPSSVSNEPAAPGADEGMARPAGPQSVPPIQRSGTARAAAGAGRGPGKIGSAPP